MPSGGWFQYISCPHYFTEIVIYVSICLFGGRNTSLWMVCCFVLTNQTVAAFLNHRWYLNTFKNYPKERKVIYHVKICFI
ncbi:polyprenol reductase-like protein [Dinothrombium tinctorium]|uniref:Polyprenal reductase n=1 Tax=Dinothrombium tinctorium TaxID=1965070 RepID=A0A3S3PYD0_9ACAR|nr:polyprenol reductase-like protein [Dinothrombium tinctorium]RWR99030.1 polyprenol reductase-like protein [Dinothrombium tinctorium]RWR99031.1 polyprenol reductase-like protein [Dinothrombium tinctorium]RWR99070.1 polyprenol reductase-like protein [Dinothrombium tinctorium]RWS00102.1 polyprenol reductase-like protein [Dinothrombium tinctorium]